MDGGNCSGHCQSESMGTTNIKRTARVFVGFFCFEQQEVAIMSSDTTTAGLSSNA